MKPNECVMKRIALMCLVLGFFLLGACSGPRSISKTEMTTRNYKKFRHRQAPINSLLYAKRWWKPKYKRNALLSFKSKKKQEKKVKKPEYTHE